MIDGMNGVYYVPAFQVHESIDRYHNQPVRLTVQVAWIFFLLLQVQNKEMNFHPFILVSSISIYILIQTDCTSQVLFSVPTILVQLLCEQRVCFYHYIINPSIILLFFKDYLPHTGSLMPGVFSVDWLHIQLNII